MVLFLPELNLEPLGHALLALCVAVGGHGKIQVSRPEFGIDLGVDSLFDFLVQHSYLFVKSYYSCVGGGSGSVGGTSYLLQR